MLNVFIADDDRLTLEGLMTLVAWEKIGMRVMGTAESGTSALARIRVAPPDLLLTDISMPGMSGVELAREALSVWKDMYIVFLTGYADFSFAQEGLRLGVKDYILKPIDYAVLSDALAMHARRITEIEPDVEDGVRHVALKSALKYMRANIERNVSLQETAKALKLSPGHLSRLFKSDMNTSFSEVSARMRMEHVKRLLDDPALRVTDVAERMNYHNMSLFHAKFKEMYAMTPGEYKRGGERTK